MIEIITVIVRGIECIDKNGIVSRHQGIIFPDQLPKGFKPIIMQQPKERNLDVTRTRST